MSTILHRPYSPLAILLVGIFSLVATTDLLADEEATSGTEYFRVVDRIADFYSTPVVLPTSKAEAGSDILNGLTGTYGGIDRDAIYGRGIDSAGDNATDSLERNGYFSGHSPAEQDLAIAQQRMQPDFSSFDNLGQSVTNQVQDTGPTAPDSTMSRNGYFGGRTLEAKDFSADQAE